MTAWMENSLGHYARELRARARRSEKYAARMQATRPDVAAAAARLAEIAREAADLYQRELDKRKCAGCAHGEHLGMCSGRNGGTAYPCPCLLSSHGGLS